MATIHVIQGPDKGQTCDLPSKETRVGRFGEDLHITDPTVSRDHARLLPDGSEWYIEDLGSANGTYVNGVRLRRTQKLRQGDQIRVGSTLLVFGGSGPVTAKGDLDIDEDGMIVDSSIMASVPSNEDSVIMPTPEASDRAIGNLRSLYQLIDAISNIFDEELLLNRVLDHICELMHPDRAYVLMFGKHGDMKPLAVRYHDDIEDKNQSVPISRTIINHVRANAVGVLCSNAMRDKRFTKGHSVHDFAMRSVLCVPITGRERILGVIHVDTSVSNVTYSSEQLRMLTAIGYQTGLAVENVRLYEASIKSERLAAVGEAVASLSHSIKNILQALQAGTDVVTMSMEQGNLTKARQSWPIVTRNMDRINALILNMLAFSKPRQPLLQSVNINSIMRDCVELISPQAEEAQIALLGDLGDVPPIAADAEGLHQAFMNLLSNALDAVERKTGAVTITSSFDAMMQLAKISISDNGPGIDQKVIDHLFEPFFSTKGQKGTGLGLAVSNKVVAEHGGRIDVSNHSGGGAVFTVILPAAPGNVASDETHA